MSNKLNAEELAAKRWPESGPTVGHAIVDDSKREAYAEAIREVAQPIADERDELREALKLCLESSFDGPMPYYAREKASAILAKYPKP
jgi:hypothetical protein